MKKISVLVSFIFVLFYRPVLSQSVPDTSIYLITCSPGTETYSIYGHSAVRVSIHHINSDTVYNWGVFDFSTPNFAWKFAKGRLDYLLDNSDFNRFLQEYYYEKRSVYLQRINLNSNEKGDLLSLIHENLLPQNKSYRYDFFYDDCSTRIRDLIEKAVGKKLIYPPDDKNQIRTFRELVGEYQSSYPWLKMGVDLIMGTPGEKKARFRERMFLPLYLQKNLSKALINRDQKMVPLLASPETILQFDPPETKSRLYTAPIFIFTLLLIAIVVLSAVCKKGRIIKAIDIAVFAVFSILAVLMIFFNFFTDHQQMKLNLNVIWFNPLIIICLICLILKRTGTIWFKIVFYLSVIFLPLILIFPFAFNSSFFPVILILIFRSSILGKFRWNPMVISE